MAAALALVALVHGVSAISAAEQHWDAVSLVQSGLRADYRVADEEEEEDEEPYDPWVSFVPGEQAECKSLTVAPLVTVKEEVPPEDKVKAAAQPKGYVNLQLHRRAKPALFTMPWLMAPALPSSEPDSVDQEVKEDKWVQCEVKGSQGDNYTVRMKGTRGKLENHLVAGTAVRKTPRNNWFQPSGFEDPAVPNPVPGQKCGCDDVMGCMKRLSSCIMDKRKKAEENCGSTCDLVMIGDSITERLTGRRCYGAFSKFDDEAKVFKDLVAKPHPKSLVLGGSCDETSNTLRMLDQVLPVLRAPKVYFVLIGTNNIPKGGGASAVRGVKAVVTKLREMHPQAHVLLHAVLPRGDGEEFKWDKHIEAANLQLKYFAEMEGRKAERGGVEYVDCSFALQGKSTSEQKTVWKRLYDDHKLHPNALGYRALLDCLGTTLDRAIGS